MQAVRRTATRWFWQVPFNPDARNQILAYIKQTTGETPIDRKTGKEKADKKTLMRVLKTSGDQVFQLILDWKAVQKVDGTYALATLKRLDANGRLHSTFTFAPSTLRDSSKDPNLQNVCADRDGPAALASGFRRCVVARDGIPADSDPATLAAWEREYAQ